jgi:SAM-dependent methyltransferase
MADQPVDLSAVTQVQQRIWSKGDFSMIGAMQVIVAEELAEAADILPGERALDVACGSGNAAIAAARRAWGNTVGADYVPELLERGRERAAAERVEVDFVEADAQDLPFEDGSFDVVLSTFGAMFAPDQQKAADELLRVCRPDGRIGMANWTPDSYVGEMFATAVEHAPPPPGVQSPNLWGSEEHLRGLFGNRVSSLRVSTKQAVFRYRSAEHWLEFFRTYFGPIQTAFERVGSDGEEALASDLKDLAVRSNTAGDRAMRVSSEYLEVIAVRA